MCFCVVIMDHSFIILQETEKLLWQIIQKGTKKLLNNLKLTNIIDNKAFWKNIREIFPEIVAMLTKLHL